MVRLWLQILAIITIALGVYQFAPHAQFMPIDDDSLTFKNPLVQEINLETLKGVFSTYDPELYVPLTMISYQLDYFFGGENPQMFHITNLVLHIINAVLVLFFIRQLPKHALTQRKGTSEWIPFITALLFAIHPIHTEAVMWIASRKDLLSTTFYIGSLILYCRNRRQQSRTLFLGSLTLFICGLLSKVSVATLPLLLLVINDFIPAKPVENERLLQWAFSIPALVFLCIGMFGKTLSVYFLSYTDTFLLAAKSSVFYLQQMLWPLDFLLFYQQSTPVTLWSVEFALPLCIIGCLIALAMATRKYTKLISFGLLWYGITVLPNLANFSRWNTNTIIFASDRYAYIPSIGIFFLVASIVVIVYNSARLRHLIATVSIGVIVSLGLQAHRQSVRWLTPTAILTHAITKAPHTYLAHTLLGIETMNIGHYPEAITHFRHATDVLPNFSDARSLLGLSLIKNDQVEEGIGELQETINLEPEYIPAHIYLAFGYMMNDQNNKAQDTLEFVLQLQPKAAKALHLLGTIEHQQGNTEKAREYYESSLKANPKSVQVKTVLSRLLQGL